MGRYPKMWPVGGHPVGEAKVRQLQRLDLPWARASGPGWVAEKQGDFANVKYGEKKKLYMDFGWLGDSGTGWPTEAGTGRFSVTHSDLSVATVGSLDAWMKDNGAGSLYKVFVNTIKNDGARAGKSFGIDVVYSGTAEQIEAAKALDAAKLTMKKKALPMTGATTGLMRCLVKGVLGLPLRKTPDVIFEWDSFSSSKIKNFTFDPWSAGVLIGQESFHIVQIHGATATITPVSIPKEIRSIFSVVSDLYVAGDENRTAICAATFLLAYAEIGNSTDAYTIDIAGGTESPLLGWRFSMFENKCVGTSMGDAGADGALMKVQVITFVEQVEDIDGVQTLRFSASSNIEAQDYFETSAAPYVWIPLPQEGRLVRVVNVGGEPSTSARPPMNAYFDIKGRLVIERIGVHEKDNANTPSEEVANTSRYDCGSGTGEEFIRSESRYKQTSLVSISSPSVSATAKLSASFSERKNNYSTTPLVYAPPEVAGTTYAPAGWCSKIEIDTATPPGAYPRYRPYICDHTTNKNYINGYEYQLLATVLPFWFVDSCIYVEGQERTETKTIVSTFQQQVTQALREFATESDAPLAEYYYPVNEFPPFLGYGAVTTNTFVPQSTNFTASAPVLTGTEMAVRTVGGSVPSQARPPLYSFVYGVNELGFLPYVLHSMHGQSWAMIHPSIGDVVTNGPEWIGGKIPIGFE